MTTLFKHQTHPAPLLLLASLVLSIAGIAAQPFNSATVTRLENQVAVGHQGQERAAAVTDVIAAKDYLHTQAEARAELKFSDKSIVRVGQNTVFSFDADSRTLSLQKGAMLFYIPPGSGGGKIKTPSLTAAVTGTIASVWANGFAVLSGEVTLEDGTVVHAGEALEMIDGKPVIYKFAASDLLNGKLYGWGGPLPELMEIAKQTNPLYNLPDLHWLDVQDWSVLNPQFHVKAIKPEPPVIVPKPKTTTPIENPPYL